jgi:glycosyltransferase involved in cell wall biosynthesis
MKSYNSPKITVITSVLNDAENLINAINSIRVQNCPSIEYIIIDGGSTDKTLDVIKENSDIIHKWISEKDNGIYSAWNKGIKLATGEWICFLGADDIFMPNVLNILLLAAVNSNDDIEYISGKTDLFLYDKYLRTTGEPFVWHKFRKNLCTGHNAAFHHISLYKKYGLYNENFRSAGDYEFLLRAGSNLKTLYVDIVTTRMNLGGVSNNSINAINEAHIARASNNTNNSLLELWLIFKGYISFYLKKYNVFK